MKNNPHKNAFDIANNRSYWLNCILYSSTTLLILTFLIPYFNIKNENIEQNIITALNVANCFLVLSYLLLDENIKQIIFKANIGKRKDFIDNSFGTNIFDGKSIDYFTNDKLEQGIYKMAVNSFENSLFSSSISKIMLKKVALKNIILAFVMLGVILIGERNVVIFFIQLSLPILLIQDLIKFNTFNSKLESIYDNFRNLFSELKKNPDHKNDKGRIAQIIYYMLEYESIIAWGNTLLDGKIYDQENPNLSTKWEKIKTDYNIH